MSAGEWDLAIEDYDGVLASYEPCTAEFNGSAKSMFELVIGMTDYQRAVVFEKLNLWSDADVALKASQSYALSGLASTSTTTSQRAKLAELLDEVKAEYIKITPQLRKH